MASFNLWSGIAPKRNKRIVTQSAAMLVAKAHPPNGNHNFTLTDTVVDASGNPVVGAVVKLFRTGDDSLVQQATTNGSGVYLFTLPENAGNYYVVAYLTGTPDTFGTSKNNLIAT